MWRPFSCNITEASSYTRFGFNEFPISDQPSVVVPSVPSARVAVIYAAEMIGRTSYELRGSSPARSPRSGLSSVVLPVALPRVRGIFVYLLLKVASSLSFSLSPLFAMSPRTGRDTSWRPLLPPRQNVQHEERRATAPEVTAAGRARMPETLGTGETPTGHAGKMPPLRARGVTTTVVTGRRPSDGSIRAVRISRYNATDETQTVRTRERKERAKNDD